MLYIVVVAALVAVIVWNVRNNSKLKAEVIKLKAEAAAKLAAGEQAVSTEVKKVL